MLQVMGGCIEEFKKMPGIDCGYTDFGFAPYSWEDHYLQRNAAARA